MKAKTILAISLATNAVLLSAVGYIATQDVKLPDVPPILRFVTNSAPLAVERTAATAPDPAPDEHAETAQAQ